MATTKEMKRRIRVFAEQLHAELGGTSVGDEECWLAVVEEVAAEVGDAFSTAWVEKESSAYAEPAEVDCPKCGEPGHYRDVRQRELITRRGPATVSEPEFYCRRCRKSFFPDDAHDRRGG